MADQSPRLRVVGSGEGSARRPGPAVVWILLYAGLFAVALVFLRARSPLLEKHTARKPDARPSADGARGTPSHDALLTGQGVPAAARNRYFQRLATERCDCDCGRSLADCLVHEATCKRSAQVAGKIWMESQRAAP